MSVIRFSRESNVYVFMLGDDPPRWQCCGCWLKTRKHAFTRWGIVRHMTWHKLRGHAIPLLWCIGRVLPGREQ